MTETTIPLMPSRDPEALLAFYGTLGFAVTYDQRSPYLYLSLQRGGIELHFSDFSGFSARTGLASCLVMVEEIASYHRAFSDALRNRYGRVPTTGHPRISRLRNELDRFGLYDPAGNWLIFLQPPAHGDGSWDGAEEEGTATSPLQTALGLATLYRDYKGNDDVVAAKILDVGLRRDDQESRSSPLDRALALAARAEIAVALGEGERTGTLLAEIASLPLTPDQYQDHRAELEAALALEAWIANESQEARS